MQKNVFSPPDKHHIYDKHIAVTSQTNKVVSKSIIGAISCCGTQLHVGTSAGDRLSCNVAWDCAAAELLFC